MRAGGHVRDDHRRRRAGDAGHVVMLRQPVAGKAEPLGFLRQVPRVAKGRCGSAALRDRGEVENREPEHPTSVTRRTDWTEAT